jgi:type I restriction enzyme S subunit
MTWPTPMIGDVCLPTLQGDPARTKRISFRYVDIAGIDRDSKSILCADEVQSSDAPSRARKMIETSDVLVSTVRPSLNAIALVPESLNGEIASTGFAVLRANRAVLDPKYLFYWAQSKQFVDFLVANATGASYPAVTDGIVKRAPIPLASPREQSRIVELLDEADRLRRLRRDADAKAARILPALFLKMFGDPAKNPKGWPVVPLSDFANSVSRRNPSTSPDEPFQYIDIAGVDGELGLITMAKRMVGRDAPSRARQVVRWRDTVVSTVRPYLRATALVPKELDNEIASTGFCVLRPREPNGYAWLFQLTRLQWFTEQLNVRARGASYPAVTDADIFQLPIPLPCDSKLFDQFDDQFESVTRVLLTAGAASEKVDAAFNLMLQRAFSGELTAKWREGHIQELLAEMAQQARALNLPMPKELEALS